MYFDEKKRSLRRGSSKKSKCFHFAYEAFRTPSYHELNLAEEAMRMKNNIL